MCRLQVLTSLIITATELLAEQVFSLVFFSQVTVVIWLFYWMKTSMKALMVSI